METRVIKSKIILQAPVGLVFVTFFTFDFLQVFKGLWFVANFNYILIKEQYFRPGFEQSIYFDNGATAKRKLNTFLPGCSFSAVVYHFSPRYWAGLIAIEYHFSFREDQDPGLCVVECEYHFIFRSKPGAFFFDVFAKERIYKSLRAVLEERALELKHKI